MKFPLGFKSLGGYKRKSRIDVSLYAACSVPLLSGSQKGKGRKPYSSSEGNGHVLEIQTFSYPILSLEFTHYIRGYKEKVLIKQKSDKRTTN